MKIKSIAAICKKAKTILLYTKREECYTRQYIGDGCAAYPLEGVPELDVQNVMAIFDIQEKGREDWVIQAQPLPEDINFADTDPSEKLLDPEKVQLVQSGRVFQVFQSRQGCILIDSKYLNPVLDMQEVIEFYERVTPQGIRYVAVKAGFMLKAVIFPVKPGEIAENLLRIAKGIHKSTEYEKMCAHLIGPQEQEP